MHPISDKELDKLFQQRFKDLEFSPSDAVWGKITGKLDRQKSGNSSIPGYWLAAASVIILISAGLWFYRPAEVIKLRGNPEIVQIKADSSRLPEINEPLKNTESERTKPAASTLVKSAGIESGKYKLSEESTLPETNTELPVEKELIVMSSGSVKRSNPVQPKQSVKIPAGYSGDQSQLDVTQPDLIAKIDLPQEDIKSEEPQKTESRKIRSIGSLVNFVIARVDKREDKIIEFKDGEEGSELSGVNLGLVKFKSRK